MNALTVFAVTGWILAGLGTALILLGLFAKRIVVHTAPHCAKCKYPLADVPTTRKNNNQPTCPECGRVPTNHTENYTMRSKRWCIPLGILLFAAALLLPHTNSIRNAGWTSVLPISSQIDLWPNRDPKLRDRIFNAYAAGSLSKSQTTKLHAVLKETLINPNTQPVEANAITPYIRAQTTAPLFTEQDYAEALIQGDDRIKSSIIIFIRRNGIPQTHELRQARRAMTSEILGRNQTYAIEWLVECPSDDLEDAELIHDLVTSTDRMTASNTQDAFDRADALALKVLASTFTSENPKDRVQALRCFEEYISHARDPDLEPYALQIAHLINDPDPTARELAFELTQQLPASVSPILSNHLTTSTDPEFLDALLYCIQRMNSRPSQLLPDLAQLSATPNLPLITRLDAATTYLRLKYGTVHSDNLHNLFPAYDALIQALVNQDYTTNFLVGTDIKYHCHNWTATALSRYLINNNIARSDLESWFDNHPAVSALLTIWEPLTFDPDLMPDITPELQSEPIHRFHKTLINASKRHQRSYERVTDAADEALERYFPSEPSP